ncbi:MAG: TonB family protein [Bacteroidota bacterium]
MELKKNKKYNLEPKRPLFFGIGMIITLSLVLVAFEWKSPIDPVVLPQEPEEEIWYVHVDPVITRQKEPLPPKPLAEKKKIITPAAIIEAVTEEFAETEDVEVLDQGEEIIELSGSEIALPEEKADSILLFAEDQPAFPGGMRAFYEQIAEELNYPRKAQRLGVEGRVSLKFVVDRDGSITGIEVVKGIGAGCDQEAVRVLETLPKFSPGKQRGKPVKVQMQIPIYFRLD